MFFIEESSSDEEVVNLCTLRRELRCRSDPLSLCENEFQKHFRLSREAFKYVLDTIETSPGWRSTAIPPVLKLAATLNLLGSGSYQINVGTNCLLGMAQSTISKVFTETIKCIENKLCEKWIKLNAANFNATKKFFYEKYKIPGIVGCIDGTHVFILKPKQDDHMYFNRKCAHSVNVMIICDHSYRITAVNACYGGAAIDSFVWSMSNEKTFFENRFESGDRNSRLLGDTGYEIAPWLLTPYLTPNARSGEENFNAIHSKARSYVERTIGILKGRWRCLSIERRMRFSPEKVCTSVNACVALHNICVQYNIPFNPADLGTADDGALHVNAETEDWNLERRGEKIRNQIRDFLIQ